MSYRTAHQATLSSSPALAVGITTFTPNSANLAVGGLWLADCRDHRSHLPHSPDSSRRFAQPGLAASRRRCQNWRRCSLRSGQIVDRPIQPSAYSRPQFHTCES